VKDTEGTFYSGDTLLVKEQVDFDKTPLAIVLKLNTSGFQLVSVTLHKDSEDGGLSPHEVVREIKFQDRFMSLHEIYGMENSSCVVCLTNPKDTALIPCRHMCLCLECAQEFKKNYSSCPICREPVNSFLQIKSSQET